MNPKTSYEIFSEDQNKNMIVFSGLHISANKCDISPHSQVAGLSLETVIGV